MAPVFHTLLTHEMPPTLFTTTLIQHQFQNIIDAYGVARYREANPAVFTMVTFPFLFAVMFGDLGHGIVMLLFAAYLVVNEVALGKVDLGDIVGMLYGGALTVHNCVCRPGPPVPANISKYCNAAPTVFGTVCVGAHHHFGLRVDASFVLSTGRYLILFMAVFSMYTGALYNEFFSIAMQAFGRQHFVCPTNPALDNPVAMHFDHASCPEAFQQVCSNVDTCKLCSPPACQDPVHFLINTGQYLINTGPGDAAWSPLFFWRGPRLEGLHN